jgi:hypothetical protein
MNSDQEIEHIFLASEEEAEMGPRTTHRKFRQIRESTGYRAAYEVFNQHYLEIRVKKFHAKPSQYTVDLAFLDSTPIRCRTIDWLWLGVALALLAITAALAMYAYHSSQSLIQSRWLPVTVLVGMCASIAALISIYRSSDKLVFYSQHGRAPLLELLNKKPKENEFKSLVEELIRRIRIGQKERYPSTKDLLVAELREHRRLRDEGIIGATQYEAIKARILQCHAGHTP